MSDSTRPSVEQDESAPAQTPLRLAWERLRRNRPAVVGGIVLAVLYGMATFAPFLSPYDFDEYHVGHRLMSPQPIHFLDESGRLVRPFVYELEIAMNMETLELTYLEVDDGPKYRVRLFVRGAKYRMFGVPMSVRLFGVDDGGTLFLLGTDRLGRDMLSRILQGARVSLSVPLVGTLISVVIGSLLGVASGYFGGVADHIIQRVVEVLVSFPRIPLWLALAAAVPETWPSSYVYLSVVVILSLIGWGGLARVVRGKVLAYRDEEYVLAAQAVGAGDGRIIVRHLMPGSLGHIIVAATLGIPGMILGESSLSFLGVGITPPLTSWGVLLRDAQNVQALVHHLWLAVPGIFIIVTVLSFNFLGDGIRDAADPFAM